MQVAPFALLGCALILLLISTVQLLLWRRALLWLGGVATAGVALWLALRSHDHLGFIEMAIVHPRAFVDAFARNGSGVWSAFDPMFDILLVGTAITAIACLLAFTPGERIEKIIRPATFGLLGAMLGASAVLAIVGTGFGGVAKREVYLATLSSEDVYDGDTLKLGDVSLRLWGIDAPELKQPCLPPSQEVDCGARAREHLVELVARRLILCRKPNDVPGIPRETFGRPLVVCVRQDDARDVGQAMIASGCADVFRDNGKIKSNYENAIPTVGAPRVCAPFLSPEAVRERR